MLIFDLFAIIGIGLEIWGFIWILRYNRTQKASELVSWALRNGYSENWVSEIPREHSMIIDNDLDYEIVTNEKRGGQEWTVPKEFYEFSEKRRKWSILLVIIGLAGQIIQILGNYFPQIQT